MLEIQGLFAFDGGPFRYGVAMELCSGDLPGMWDPARPRSPVEVAFMLYQVTTPIEKKY